MDSEKLRLFLLACSGLKEIVGRLLGARSTGLHYRHQMETHQALLDQAGEQLDQAKDHLQELTQALPDQAEERKNRANAVSVRAHKRLLKKRSSSAPPAESLTSSEPPAAEAPPAGGTETDESLKQWKTRNASEAGK